MATDLKFGTSGLRGPDSIRGDLSPVEFGEEDMLA